MKPTILALLIAFACSAYLRAQSVSGTELEISPTGNSNQVSGQSSGAIGYNNQVSNAYSLAVGNQNQITGPKSFAVGIYNYLQGSDSMAVGHANFIYGSEILAIGSSNNFSSNSSSSFAIGLGNHFGESLSCMAMGESNDIEGDGVVAIGWENSTKYSAEQEWTPVYLLMIGESNYAEGEVVDSFICGANNIADKVWYSTTLGEGLVNKWSHCTLIGGFNDSSVAADAGLLLAVGNGTDATHRSNAMEVYADGKIKMPRQGDILMGEFGNPEP